MKYLTYSNCKKKVFQVKSGFLNENTLLANHKLCQDKTQKVQKKNKPQAQILQSTET